MDAQSFDRLTTTLAVHQSRRGLLGAVLAGLLIRSDRALAKKKDKKKDCPQGKKRCGKDCCTEKETCKNGKKCVHHCEDGKHNKGETDKDCGGSCRTRRRCGVTEFCERNDDCASGRCTDTDSGRRCGNCLIDSDCTEHPLGPRCVNNFCRQCAADFDCQGVPGRPFCTTAAVCGGGEPCVCTQCRPGQDADCPTGQVCERGSCVPEPDQLGCTPELNNCTSAENVPCPNGPSNVAHACVVLNNGQPLCIREASCLFCSNDTDCPPHDGIPGRCITSCPNCDTGNACVYPFLP